MDINTSVDLPHKMPIDPVSAISLGLGATQQAAGIFGRKKQREHEERMALEQRRYNLAQWHRQNEYNSPKAQMERLKAAGMNPHLLYGQGVRGATGQADAVQPYDRAHSNNVFEGFKPFSQFQQLRTDNSSNELRAAQAGYQHTMMQGQMDVQELQKQEMLARGIIRGNKSGEYFHHDQAYADAVMQINSERKANKAEQDLKLKNIAFEEANEEGKKKIAAEGTTMFMRNYLSEQEKSQIRQQYLKTGAKATAEDIMMILTSMGVSSDYAKAIANIAILFFGKLKPIGL